MSPAINTFPPIPTPPATVKAPPLVALVALAIEAMPIPPATFKAPEVLLILETEEEIEIVPSVNNLS